MDTKQLNTYTGIAKYSKSGQIKSVDVNGLISKLLVFDEVFIESKSFREIITLAEVIGVEKVIELLRSGCVKVHPFLVSMGLLSPQQGFNITNLYSFHGFRVYGPEMVNNRLQNVDASSYTLSVKSRLKNALIDSVTSEETINRTLHAMADGFDHSIEKERYVIKQLLIPMLEERINKKINEDDVALDYHKIGEGYLIVSNLSQLYGLTTQESDDYVRSALLALGGLHQRLAIMNCFNTSIGFREQDLKILELKMSTVLKDNSLYNPNKQELKLARVLDIKGLPSFDSVGNLDIDKVFRLRESQAYGAFREWLAQISTRTDEEIASELNSFKAQLAAMLTSSTTRAIRIFASCVLPTMVTGHAIGGLASLGMLEADKYLVEKFIQPAAPLAFVNQELPRLYELY
jgi:hypothetical protein